MAENPYQSPIGEGTTPKRDLPLVRWWLVAPLLGVASYFLFGFVAVASGVDRASLVGRLLLALVNPLDAMGAVVPGPNRHRLNIGVALLLHTTVWTLVLAWSRRPKLTRSP
ncbi:hypothetical protein [Posidoniimonas corsicana]|uniref:hypothetical protein n=1 Tax=Posidoniimonas corsicana TaxID=1938618 RepID=UPI0011B68789|nr:hypothetical protein [Posidoniimonas corsicana]